MNPIVKSCHISFGNTHIYHDSPLIAILMHQVIYYLKVVIENSVYFVGDQIFTNLLGPVIDYFLNDYIFPIQFQSLIKG